MRESARAVTSRLRRLLDATRTLGVGQLSLPLVRWVVRREFMVFVRDLWAPWPDEVADPGVRWTDLPAMPAALLTRLDPAFREEDLGRLQREGQCCRLAWMGGRVVHYRWDTIRPAYLPYLDRWYRPQPGDVLTSWLYTARDHRGRGLQRASHADLRDQALARGCRRSLGIVATWNRPSLRANDHTGRVRVGTVGYVAVGPWRAHFATGLVRFDGEGGVTVPPTAGLAATSTHALAGRVERASPESPAIIARHGAGRSPDARPARP